MIGRWSYDENADAAYLELQLPGASGATVAADAPGDKVSVFEELGIVLDTDARGRLTGMEILGGRAVIAQLERA
jgi:uncharacterized protein YuzE